MGVVIIYMISTIIRSINIFWRIMLVNKVLVLRGKSKKRKEIYISMYVWSRLKKYGKQLNIGVILYLKYMITPICV